MDSYISFNHGFDPICLASAVRYSDWRVVAYGKKEAMSESHIKTLGASDKISVYNSSDVLLFRGAAKNMTLACNDTLSNSSFNLLKETPKSAPYGVYHLYIYKNFVCFPNAILKDKFDTIAPYYSSNLAKFICNCIDAKLAISDFMLCNTIEFECDGKQLVYFSSKECLDIIDLEKKTPVDVSDPLFMEALDMLHFITVL